MLGFVSMLMDISSEMIHALLPVYMVTVLGTSALAVGVIEGIAEATASITRIFFAWPAALIHGGLRFFERELVATELELPGDAYLLLRMLRAGVRFAMLEGVVLDYYPSNAWTRDGRPATASVLASLTHPSPPPVN